MEKVILLVSDRKELDPLFTHAGGWVHVRDPPTSGKGKRVLLYSKSPDSAILGEATLMGVLITSGLAAQDGQHAHHKGENDREQQKVGSQVKLSNPVRYVRPIPLKRIKSLVSKFVLPRSFMFIWDSDPDFARLLELVERLKLETKETHSVK
ncbi:MAG: hypothetical protein QW767_02670 [Thermoprotei archaeon]